MTHVEFGRYLSRQRELRGLSRDEISKATKISPALLEALEDGEFRRLPGRVFILQYVRAYAEVVGMAPDDAVLRYEEVEPATPPPEPVAPPKAAASVSRRPLLVLGAIVVALVVLFMIFGPHGHSP